MKHFILFLIKIFRLDIPTIKVVEVPVEAEKKVFVSLDNEVNGNCTVSGDLTVKGYLYVTGEVTCCKIKGE